jgi:mono/diheme cytochrome c family protein
MRSLLVPGLAALLLLAAASACGGSDDTDAPSLPPAERAQKLFGEHCAVCHGRTGEGTPLAPPLRGKQAHWQRESLLAYLQDPVAYAKQDERLKEQGKRYSQPMPTYGKILKPEQLGLLADHVLGLR